ncbi:DUF1822 family protein [Phormidium sp. LEGE 05292]|uniref:DUF1822 family protein n=1 Tax=[Phormidium] sp. LEGE 05292 TaxID=767427 RepID=UPI0018828FC9|nr:DUF1822 family protein [Phormidium sp. LEGE 05292]MBE9227171.1 DUF1822 family protein [Phormidium sp. LEGE 05292]
MITNSSVFNSTQIWLEFSAQQQNQAWENSQSFSLPSSRWNAYLNQICLTTVLPWLQEEYAPKAKVWPNNAALPSFWEVVNGTAIVLDNTRFVLIPSEAIDRSELRVPQEWVDIPSWMADYYLAVQVNPDDRCVIIWGYASHEQLKQGFYDVSDRTYSLPQENLIHDLNVLWLARQLATEEITRAEVTPLAILPQAQVENLLQRLGNLAIIEPRLAVPFELWGALLEHGGTRQQLYYRRMGLPQQQSIVNWLRTGVSEIAQQIGWKRIESQPDFAGAKGVELTEGEAILSRQLQIAGQQYELQVFPLKNLEQQTWRFQLQNSAPGGVIPGGFKLRLLTEDLHPFAGNEDVALTAQERLYIDVCLAPGEGLVWEIEPFPENYDREILHF